MIRLAVWICFCLSSLEGLVLEDLLKRGDLNITLEGKKVSYYIGSFDPLHLGHEGVVNKILEQKLSDYVLIYPAFGGDIYKNRTEVKIRLEMLFAAFANHPKAIVTKMNPLQLQNALMCDDSGRFVAGKSTVKTRIPETEYIGVVGSDAALETAIDLKKLSIFMEGVKIPEKYKENTIGGIMAIPVAGFIVAMRKGDSIQSLEGKIGEREVFATLETDYPDVSSTQIRKFVTLGKPIDHFVSPGVLDVINRYQLYKIQE